MRRYTGYDFEKRASSYDRQLGQGRFEYESEIVSCDGANYHVWIPRGYSKKEELDYKNDFESAARYHGDPVSFTWDYLPLEFFRKVDDVDPKIIKSMNERLKK